MNLTSKYAQVQEEMEVARRIQRSLIPATVPSCTALDTSVFLEPSLDVGGDFYDFFEPNEHTLALLIGDVSGKGIPAALHMAEIKGIVQTLAQFNLPTEEFIYRLNKAVSVCFAKNIFVTLLFMVIDKKAQTITYCRAGHCPILYYNGVAQKASYIKDKGLGLGIIRDDNFKKHINIYTRKMYPGDVYVLMTDGFEEAENADLHQRYGSKRIKKSLEQADKTSAETVRDRILEDFNAYIGDQRNQDDLGMMVIRVR